MNLSGGYVCMASVLCGVSTWVLSDPEVKAELGHIFGIIRGYTKRHLCASSQANGNKFTHVIRQFIGRAWPLAGQRRYTQAKEQRMRRAQCLDELPELIDVVALGLSAGISFDASLGMYCDRYQTMLAESLADAKRSWSLGMLTRKEALTQLSRVLSVDSFTTFVDTVTESLEFGAPLAKSLAAQAQAVRDARRSSVQERIEKAPVKMLIPTGTLVLPAMLLAILGPLMASLAAHAV